MLDICAQHDATLSTIKPLGQSLTPYAVSLRYDEEFWPSIETATEALDAARDIRAFIVRRLPAGMKPA